MYSPPVSNHIVLKLYYKYSKYRNLIKFFLFQKSSMLILEVKNLISIVQNLDFAMFFYHSWDNLNATFQNKVKSDTLRIVLWIIGFRESLSPEIQKLVEFCCSWSVSHQLKSAIFQYCWQQMLFSLLVLLLFPFHSFFPHLISPSYFNLTSFFIYNKMSKSN